MNDSDFSVPDDFPRSETPGMVAGAHPKLLLTKFQGRFYAPGCTPPEIHRRWTICEDLAQQFSQKSLETKAGKRAHMAEKDILDQYCLRAQKTGWGTDAEMRWVFRRAAAILGWPVPDSALVDAS